MLTKVKSFNYLAYNYNNSENNVLMFDSAFSFAHQFKNEKQYLIYVLYECNNTTRINNRS